MSRYQCCTNCVLDTTDTAISFDADGVCNYCNSYRQKQQDINNAIELGLFQKNISEIKNWGKNKKYDCIMGISGGLDSSYLLYLAVKAGLRVLAVHYDSGWNSENAVTNIEKLTAALNVDLYTYVVDWEEFKDVQLAYMAAGVVDLEIPTDHSFMAALYKTAARFNIKYILTGHNFATEGIMPASWVYNKGDAANIYDIHKKFGKLKHLKSFPVTGLVRKFYYYNILRIQNPHLLNYINYEKQYAAQLLLEKMGWSEPPLKHGESIWTRFYQCYILPVRFNIDKRRAHLSNLICSGQMTRHEALEKLKEPIYDEEMQQADKQFVMKKFGLTDDMMQTIIEKPVMEHTYYKTDQIYKHIYHKLNQALGVKLGLKISYRY